MTRLLVIDNYDSFTYNLVQELGALGAKIRVARNDQISIPQVLGSGCHAVVIGPGPCTPETAGISVELIRAAAGRIPVLGVCLGHQAIGVAFGAQVVRNRRIVHGKASAVHHRRKGVFSSSPNPLTAGRYHSLVISERTMPRCLEVTAWTDAREVMGVRHRRFDVEGVQFHPESVLTPGGRQLLATWLSRIAKGGK